MLLWLFLSALPLSAQLPQIPEEVNDPDAPEVTETPVEATLDPAQDAAIERRLASIYDQLEDLEGIEVEVTAGVVRLTGEVLSADDRDLARKLARSIEGVVAVDDDLSEVRDLGRRLRPARENIVERLIDLAALLPLLGVALLVFLLFVLGARAVGRWDRLFERVTPNQFLQNLARQALRAVVLLLGALLALEVLNATALVGAVLGTAGVIGLALGFAFRDTAENYIASVLLSVRQPFEPNDLVKIGEHEGKVVRLTSRATILLTLDGNHVRLPNAQVFKGVVVNYTRNPERRFDFTVGVGTEENLSEVLRVGIETLQRVPGVLEDPEPTGWIDELGESNVVVHFFGWTDQRQASFPKVRGETVRQVKEAFDAHGFFMPEPIYRVKAEWLEPGAAPARPPAPAAERPRPEPKPAPEPAVDVAPDTTIDRKVAEDRAGQAPDLLDPEAPKE